MAASTYFAQVQQLYIAYFGRPADPIGQSYWATQIDAANGSIASVIAGFSASTESAALFGNKSTIDKVTAIYQNAFGRAPEPAGLAYWVAQLDSGKVSQAQASWTIQQSAGPGDAAAVQNKLVAAQAFTAQIDTTAEIQGYQGAAAAASARAFLATVTQDPATATAAVNGAAAAVTAASVGIPGSTFTLTAGADTIVGTEHNDIINALNIDASGNPADTLTAFDSIDGGAGNDTLNIYATGGKNAGLKGATVKNVETININGTGFGPVEASKFVGATAINQVGATASVVTELGAGTVAGFNGATGGSLSVTAAAAAATANVGLTNVVDDITGLTVAGDVLNAVTVTGNVVASDAVVGVVPVALTVNAGKTVESVTINTAVASDLTIGNVAGSTKAVSSVDASASTGAITYAAAGTVSNIKTGTGADVVGLATTLTSTVTAASVSTGAGNDTVNVGVNTTAAIAGSTVTVDAGEGNDKINLTIATGVAGAANVTYNVAAGAGDDTVVITGTVKTTDKIDGGAGTDTVSLAAKAAYVADDYIVFNKVLTNFETLALTGATTTTLDASQLASGYTTIDINAGSTVTNVGTQALVAHGAVIATAKGYVAAAGATPATYAGSLNITNKSTGIVTASADKVALTVDASANNASVTLAGDAQSASVTLVQALNTGKTAYVGAAAFTFDNTTADANLSSLTLSGNGTASVINANATKLVNVDASGLNSVTFDGKVAAGLTYASTNKAAETIKLGAGIDHITLGVSTYGKVDVVSGLNLVAKAGDAKAIDASKSDILHIGGVDLTKAAALGFTTTNTDLDLALKDAAAYALANTTDVAFHLGGNTYVFHDNAAGAGSVVGQIDATDTVVQITGQVNLDLLASSLVAA